jgi:phage gp29-like protein
LPGVVIGRNPGSIGFKDGKEMYNEWPIPIETAIKNYGQEAIDSLTEEISYHKKIAKIKAIELTPEIMKILGVEGDTLKIKVDWSPEPMIAKIGDYITNGGYSVSKHDMEKTYEEVNEAKVLNPLSADETIKKVRQNYSNTNNVEIKPKLT